MTDPDMDQVKNGTGLNCLECGAKIPADVFVCPECGNDKFLMPDRWAPPDSAASKRPVLRVREETRLLAGLSVCLFIALWLLGTARAQNDVRLGNSDEDPLLVVNAENEIVTPGNDTMELTVNPSLAYDEGDIVDLRLEAVLSQDSGAWADAIDAWEAVTDQSQAQISDFISLARAYEQAGDIIGAQSALSRCIARFPDQPGGYIALGDINERNDDPSAARFQYQVGMSYCEDTTELSERLSNVESQLGLVEYPPEEPPDEDPATDQSGVNDAEIIINEPVYIDPVPVEPDSQTESEVVEPEPVETETDTENESEPDEGPVDLIGVTTDTGDDGEEEPRDGTEVDPGVTEEPAVVELINIQDLVVSATMDSVCIELSVDRTPTFSTSIAAGPDRLVVRIPDSHFAPGASIPGNVAINTPLVDRVNLAESSTDTMNVVMLVIYLGENTRHSVAATSNAVSVTISQVPETDNGEEDG